MLFLLIYFHSSDSIDPTQKEELLDMIAGVQCHRMNEQRAAVPFLPGQFVSFSISIWLIQLLIILIFDPVNLKRNKVSDIWYLK